MLTTNISFNKNKLSLLNKLISDAINNRLFTCIEVMAIQNNYIILHNAFGYKQSIPLTKNSIFDVASLTKPIITSTIIMMLYEKGKIKLDDKISIYFDEFKIPYKNEITIKQLLTHTSGLPAWHNLYNENMPIDYGISTLLSLPLEDRPNSKVVYSCMGFILLKLIIEQITSMPLDVLAKKWIFDPLNMANSYFNPPDSLRDNIVPSGESEYRKYIIHGKVHDDNSYMFNGIGGNAGLFSTAYDIAIYMNMIVNKGTYNNKIILSPNTINLMTKNHTNNVLPRGLGFQLKDNNNSPCGCMFSDKSFGHTGFTGTSFWIDPNKLMGIALLSNRSYLSYKDSLADMAIFRKEAHNIILSLLE